ncbi:unnamed protein product [Acanthoscelides obtectus]|uniref:C2H2-type domain-containing protein n=1 Tax=Acanthoscelides obtectus TaxID=200917 RepID=A0A9P0LJS2_ACAOB|nr:unnamed protein product [Acanthoscelides obtectus]CAK1675664.1 Zinc finger protein 699 [Acanthoscelides obtectus]
MHAAESHTCEHLTTDQFRELDGKDKPKNGCTMQYRCQFCTLIFGSALEAEQHIQEATCTYLQFCESCQEFCDTNHKYCQGTLLFCVSCRSTLKYDLIAQHQCFHTLTKNQQEKNAAQVTNDATFIVVCELCGKAMPVSFRKTHHKRNHPKKMLHTCPYCQKTFSGSKDVKKHKRLFHEQFLCHVCGKQMLSDETQLHVDSHENVKRYKCSICDKFFTFRDSLRKHIVIHSNEAKFICSTCGKHFKRRDNLVVHMRSHAEIKPFQCMICGKTFTTKQSRDNHMKSHKGDTMTN